MKVDSAAVLAPAAAEKRTMTLAQFILSHKDRQGERAKAAALPTLDKVRRFTGIVCNWVHRYEVWAVRKVTPCEIAEAVVTVLEHYEIPA